MQIFLTQYQIDKNYFSTPCKILPLRIYIYIRFLKGRITIFKKFINKKQKYIKKNVLLHSWKIHRTLLQTKIKT